MTPLLPTLVPDCLQVGLSAIPPRFVEGLSDGRELAALALQLATAAFPEQGGTAAGSGSGEAVQAAGS